MQHNIQDIFIKIKEKKAQLKDLRKMCKDLLESSQQYQEVTEEMKTLREKKKQIVSTIQQQCTSELIKIDELSGDIASDEEMLTDIAMNQYVQGQSIELKDEYDNTYEPVFVVKFKKSN